MPCSSGSTIPPVREYMIVVLISESRIVKPLTLSVPALTVSENVNMSVLVFRFTENSTSSGGVVSGITCIAT